MIRTTSHSLNIVNASKREELRKFLYSAKLAYAVCIDYIWNGIFTNGNKIFDISNDLLDMPQRIDCKPVSYPGLSARTINSLLDQAKGTVSAATEKRRKLLWAMTKAKDDNHRKKVAAKLLKYPLIKPGIPSNFSIELSSRCAKFIKQDNSKVVFGFVRLASLGKDFDSIILPIQNYKRLHHYSKDKSWSLKGSFLISENSIRLRWERGESLKFNGAMVGGDTGYKTVLTLSDGQATPHHDCHDHSLESICDKMNRKKKGSKAYRRCQTQRTNFINWSINQLNFKGIKQVNLEQVVNIFHKRKTSKKMARWTNSIIERKVTQLLEVEEVSLKLNKSAYRSQRCSNCGVVLKSNRKAKIYHCKKCDFKCDADLNGSKNHEIELPAIPWWLFNSGKNKLGFLWKPNGFFDLDGQELRVPDVPKDLNT